MRTLLRCLPLVVGLLLFCAPAIAQQPAACGACSCVNSPQVGTMATGLAVQNAPVPVFPAPGSTVTVNIAAVAANRYQTVNNMLLTNRYQISLCNTVVAQNTVLFIRSGTGAVINGACNDDGCAVVAGHAQLIFQPQLTGSYRIHFFKDACSADLTAPNANIGAGNAITSAIRLEITNLGPSAPTNDDPCFADVFPPLTASCSASLNGTTLGATQTATGTPLLLNSGTLRPSAAAGCGNVGYAVDWGGVTGTDVWYRVQVPASGMLGISTTESGLCAGAIGLYRSTGGCNGAYTFIGGAGTNMPISPSGNACSNNGLNAVNSPPELIVDLFAQGMVFGEDVYIRYWERGSDENGTFTICAFEPNRPTNDEPCGATVLTANTFTCTPLVQANNNATPLSFPDGNGPLSIPAPTCGLPTAPLVIYNEVWYQFTMPGTNNVTIEMQAGTLTDMAFQLYRRTSTLVALCPYTSTSLSLVANGCSDNVGASLMPSLNTLAAGCGLGGTEVVYLRTWSKTPYYGTFSICVYRPTPPVNDAPCAATPLAVTNACNVLPTTNADANNWGPIVGAGPLITANPSCGTAPFSSDVWYSVIVPTDLVAPYGVQISTTAGVFNSGGMAVYYRASGSCTASPNPNRNLTQVTGACNAPGLGLMPSVLVSLPSVQFAPGDTLWVRVWREGTTPTYNNGAFGICARRTDPQQCEGFVYDPGGASGNYLNNHNGTLANNSLITYCANKVGDVVTLDFQSFAVENFFDVLTIYNGPLITDPVIGTYTGNVSPGVVTATISAGNPSGCLTLRFTTDGSVVAAGWVAKLYCGPPPPTPPNAPGICDDFVYDPGGPSSPYLNNIGNLGNPYFIATYCPSVAGEVVTVNFQSFNVETFWDALYVFNASGIATVNGTTQINSGNGAGAVAPTFGGGTVTNGGFWGNGLVGPFTADITTFPGAGGCLTFIFVSDPSVTPAGWAAQVTCGPPPPPPPPPLIGGGPPSSTSCGTLFLDAGANANYSNFEDMTRTICPAVAGDVVTLTYQSFGVEAGFAAGTCFDMMYVHDGNSVAAPIFNSGYTALAWPPFNPYGNGGWCGTTPPGPFTSSAPNGCLTTRFWSDNTVTGSGWRAVVSCATPPGNDNPCDPVGAISLTPSTSCIPTACTNVVASATPSSIVPAPSCGNFTAADVWYTFTAPANGRVFINSRAGTLRDGAMELYSAATCGGPFTFVECDDDDGENLMPMIDRLCDPLTGGATYWLRFWGYGGETGTFELCITTTSTQTSQQDCAGSFTVCSSSSFTGTSFGSGCSSDLLPANRGCLSWNEHQGSWYAFNATAVGTLGLTITPSTPRDLDWAIWGPFSNTGAPTAVANGCASIITTPPIRCSSASLLNTTTAAGAAAPTGMGNASAVLNSPQYAPPAPALRDGGLPLILPNDGWVPGINIGPNEVYLLFIDDHHQSGASHTVTWNVSPSTAMDCILLPVDLVTLEANQRQSTVDLTWTTGSEQNSSHFVVERSGDGESYQPIGTVAAMGTTTSPTDYLFTDDKPLRGLNYYRLQQVDLNSSATPTNVVTALFEPEMVKVMVVPNPTRDRAEVLLSVAYAGTLQVRVSDGSGRIVASFKTMSGVQRFDLPTTKMEAGSYTVQLFTENGEAFARTRFVKQ